MTAALATQGSNIGKAICVPGAAAMARRHGLCSPQRLQPLLPTGISLLASTVDFRPAVGELQRVHAMVLRDLDEPGVDSVGHSVMQRLSSWLLQGALAIVRALARAHGVLLAALTSWQRRSPVAAVQTVRSQQRRQRPATASAAAVAVAPVSPVPDARVLGLVDTLQDPLPSHDARWAQLESALLRGQSPCSSSARGLYAATGECCGEVERYRAATGRQEPSSGEMWGLGSTAEVLAHEEALKSEVFRRMCEELHKRDCESDRGKRC